MVCAEPFILSVVICLINLGTLISVGHDFTHGASKQNIQRFASTKAAYEQLIAENNLDNSKGKLLISKNFETNIKGVFAGGDCVNGGKEVVDAVQAGKDGAKGILDYFKFE